MTPEAEQYLLKAHSAFGQCASTIISRKLPISTDDRIRVQACGIARDYIRWAAALKALKFATKPEDKSARVAGITESVRFIQLWTAANALFGRDELMALVGFDVNKTAELIRFKGLYEAASVNKVLEGRCLITLYDVLGIECYATNVVSKITQPRPIRP